MSHLLKSLLRDKEIAGLNNEEEILGIMLKKFEALGINGNECDLLIKKFFKVRGKNTEEANQIKVKNHYKNTVEYKFLMKQRKMHYDKIHKLEAEIEKHVTYEVMNNKEKNCIFLFDNMNFLNLKQEDIQYYILGYNHLIFSKTGKRKLQDYLHYANCPEALRQNSHYDRMAARNYARTYCGNKLGVFDSEGYNISSYPVFDTINYPHNDCANFASQCIFAGGKTMTGTKYGDANAWFCNTKDSSKLQLISYTWRATGGFKTYWKARSDYSEVKMKNAYSIKDFISNIYDKLYYGDIIQLADAHGAPWHTLNVTAYSTESSVTDIGYTTHSVNRKDQSLFSMTNESEDLLLLYHLQ